MGNWHGGGTNSNTEMRALFRMGRAVQIGPCDIVHTVGSAAAWRRTGLLDAVIATTGLAVQTKRRPSATGGPDASVLIVAIMRRAPFPPFLLQNMRTLKWVHQTRVGVVRM